MKYRNIRPEISLQTLNIIGFTYKDVSDPDLFLPFETRSNFHGIVHDGTWCVEQLPVP
jgi:hypothetical protein